MSSKCPSCGYVVQKSDRECPYCGSANEAFKALHAEAEIDYAKGMEALNSGKYAIAVTHLTRTVDFSPDCVEAYFYLCHSWHRLGNTAKAIEAMKRAVALRPQDPYALFNLGVFCRQANETADARRHFEQALDYARGGPKAKGNKEFHDRVRAALKSLK